MLSSALGKAVETVQTSEKMQMQAMAGKVELTDLVTAVAQADLTVQTVIAVRDRVIAAYQEISRMPI
jgi:flagellar hook-basal body complex protein FliE